MTEHRIVLVGGGHTHVQVMRAFAERPQDGARLTLVTDRIDTPYSGMLPGHVAGVYDRAQMHIDLKRLAQVSGVEFIHARAVGVDRANKILALSDGGSLRYDTLSLNVGITPDLSGIEGADRHAIAVKPISSFLERMDGLDRAPGSRPGERRILVVGGGAGGIEIALALRARYARAQAGAQQPSIGLLASSGLVPSLNSGVRRRIAAALARNRVTVLEGFRVAKVTGEGAIATDGRFVPADDVIVSTAARAPGWLAALGLPVARDGSVLTRATLASVADDAIFAVGDCGAIEGDAREKAGVFAVRQGPPLTENLRRRVSGAPLTPYKAQRAFLTILATGDGRAVAGRGRWLALEGAWVWRWKDRIDRTFMARFNAFRR